MSEPDVIGRYIIEKEIGRGGMSFVYLARDPYMKRRVAIKAMPHHYAADPGFILRFRREAQVIAALEHPAIVPVYDFGDHEGQPYIVMRYMPGGSLADRVRRGPMNLSDVLAILHRLAPALDEAHAQGVIHRDLKPANILFDQHDRAYLCDFGLVKLSESQATPLTSSGGVLGTPAYMSPEQARGIVELDQRTDIYSLGVVIYELLTGVRPYQAETPMGLAMAHLLEPVPCSTDEDINLSGCEAVVAKAMAKNREERYSTASEMAVAASQMIPSDPRITPRRRRSRRRDIPRPLFWAVTAICLLLAATVVTLLIGGIPPSLASPYNTPTSVPPAATPLLTAQSAISNTVTPSLTPTPTLTPTVVLSPTVSAAGAEIPTDTPSSTPTPTWTATRIIWPTSTPRPWPTATFTPPPPTATFTQPPPPPPPTSAPVVQPTNTKPPPAPTNTPPAAATNTPPALPTEPPPEPTNTPPV